MIPWGQHLRGARAILKWSQAALAAKAKIDVATVRRLEATDGPLSARTDTIFSLLAVFKQAGIAFPDEEPEVVKVHWHLRRNKR